MTKFRTLIRQLSKNDYIAVKKSLMDSNAEKTAILLETVREDNPGDDVLMTKLNTSAAAYYALRSRLNQRIEEYLVQQMENPRTDLFKKVLMINEIIFTKPKDIAVATLKKLEKELKKYDLSNELTVVYKSLKKLNIHSPNYFQYSQLYNRHVAYMLTLDKAEDILSEYFKKYGHFLISGDDGIKTELKLLKREMHTNCSLYQSHRLFVYNSCVSIFHRLFVDSDEKNIEDNEKPTDDLLKENEDILSSYKMDSTYFHLSTVFDFLWLSYYDHYNVNRKVEIYYDDLNAHSPQLLTNFNLFTFPGSILILKLRRAIRLGNTDQLYEENSHMYSEILINKSDIPLYYIYATYRALSAYYSREISEAISWITPLISEISWKKFPLAMIEARILLVFFHYLNDEPDMVKMVGTSIQRQIRVIGKENCQIPFTFYRLQKAAMNDMKKNKSDKVREYISLLNLMQPNYYSPLKYINMDDQLIGKLISSTHLMYKQKEKPLKK